MILIVFSSTVLSKPNAWHVPASRLSLLIIFPNKISATGLHLIHYTGYIHLIHLFLFQIFYWTHFLYLVFWLLLILHTVHFWKWIVGPFALFVAEKLIRFYSLLSNQGWNSWTAFLDEVSRRKLDFSQTRVFVWFPTVIFPFYKMCFMKGLEFSCFGDFFGLLKAERISFSLKSANRRDCE